MFDLSTMTFLLSWAIPKNSDYVKGGVQKKNLPFFNHYSLLKSTQKKNSEPKQLFLKPQIVTLTISEHITKTSQHTRPPLLLLQLATNICKAFTQRCTTQLSQVVKY